MTSFAAFHAFPPALCPDTDLPVVGLEDSSDGTGASANQLETQLPLAVRRLVGGAFWPGTKEAGMGRTSEWEIDSKEASEWEVGREDLEVGSAP